MIQRRHAPIDAAVGSPSAGPWDRHGEPSESTPKPRGLDPISDQPGSFQDDIDLVRFSVETDRTGRSTVSVTLSVTGNEATGTASGSSQLSARSKLVAEATLQALHLLPAPVRANRTSFVLHGVKEVDAVGRCFVLVVVQSVQDQETKALVGCTQVEDSRDSAVVRATIQAVDRRVRALH